MVISGDRAAAKTIEVDDPTFGRGRAMVIAHDNGPHDQIAVFDGRPFAVVRTTQFNRDKQANVTKYATSLTCLVDLGATAKDLVTLGTGGLLPLDKNPGSYAWLAMVEPTSRRGIVCGWLTHDRGSGIVFSGVDNGAAALMTRIDYGRLRTEPGSSVELETLAIGYFDDARFGLEAWADAVADVYKIELPPQPMGYCTWYSRPHGGASDEKHLAELAEFAAEKLAPYGFSVVQIDDKWQAGESTNGPKRNFTTHNPDGPYPSGMKAIAERVTALGLTPGLWFMPFAGTHYDPHFKDHQDWFVKDEAGKPYETKWGGTCLDLTNPEVREYVRSVADRIVNDWGFRYLKMDGLWTGTGTPLRYVSSGYKDDGIGDAVFHDPAKTNIEAYRDGLKLVRETVGRKTFLLGCNGPQNMRSYGGAMGLVDAMRVGPDNGSDWNKLLRGPEFGSRHYFLHGRVWYNDPDPMYVREDMPLEHARLIASWVALSGQLNLCSEWIPGLPAERLAILQRTMPNHAATARPVDLFERDPPRLWLVTDERSQPRRDVIGAFNWDRQERMIQYSVTELGLEAGVQYAAFDYWANEITPPIEGQLRVTVPGRSCRVLAVRPRSDRPQLISTSRHVTQGMIDVTAETWDAASRTLRGKSRLVGGDSYELRIVVPDTRWKAKMVTVSDNGSDVSASVRQEGTLVRATLQSQGDQEIAWAVAF